MKFYPTRITSGALALIFLLHGLSACAQLHTGDGTKTSFTSEKEPPQEPVGLKKNGMLLVYPRNGATINCSSTFLIGCVPPGSDLFCNAQPVKTNAAGFYAHTVKLQHGENKFKLSTDIQGTDPLEISVRYPLPASTLPDKPLQILPSSPAPAENIGVTQGDIIEFACRATPGSTVAVHLSNRVIPLEPVYNPKAGKKASSVKLGIDTAFGVSFQGGPTAQKDLYVAFYKVGPQDRWHDTKVVYVASKNKTTVRLPAHGQIRLLEQPAIFSTIHNNTIVRVGPDAARITPLDEGVRLLSDGYKGKWCRLLLAPGKHAWILREDLAPDADTGSYPQAKIATVNLESDAYGARVVLPLNQRLAYQIDQTLKPNRLVLHVFGATADTDFVTADIQNSPDDSASARLIEDVSWKQKGDLHYELSILLKPEIPWGFFANYEGSNLVLHIKNPPKQSGDKTTLKGTTICLDAGHGGQETGSLGCNGTKESTINLAITERLRRNLENLGATVVMTRMTDTDVSLTKRVETAIAARADLLISIHNNALPDGRDPAKELGTSSYWYQPQSTKLARLIKNNLASASGFPDYGSRYQNLALCRPSQMPAVLVEVGFMINPEELVKLLNPEFQQKVADSIAGSIRQYISDSI